MALDLANIKSITTKSGVTIKKVQRKSDGKVLWKASEPFYWIKDGVVQSGYHSTYTNYSISPDPSDNEGCSYDNSLTAFTIGSASEETGFQFVGSTASVETKGNKYMEVTLGANVSSYGSSSGNINSFKIAGIECNTLVKPNAVMTVDVSNFTTANISLDIECWAWGNYMYLPIKSIAFYG